MSGAGKSTVCRVFAERGFTVIDCDRAAREVAEAGSPFLKELAERLSPELIAEDGSLDRKRTAKMIFGDPKKRELYNRLIFPYITYNVIRKMKAVGGNVLLDAPTLFEARLEPVCDCIVSVCADEDICVKRIMERDGISEELARARLSSQHGAEFFREHSDLIIENNSSEERLFIAAAELIAKLSQQRRKGLV